MTLGLLLVGAGIATAFVQAVLIQRTVPRYGEKRMALTGLLSCVIGWPLFIAAPSLWMLFPISFVFYGISGFIWATTGAMAANRVSEQEQGRLAGVNVALAGLMAIIRAAVGGYRVRPGHAQRAILEMGAVILGVACLLIAQVKVGPPAQGWSVYTT
jgi:MFS family permease